MTDLDYYKPIAEAISLLFFPHVEVVIHDLKKKCIRAIYNNFSKRKKGEESLLGEDYSLSQALDVIAPYFKTNWNGKKIKSVTAVLRDPKQKPIGLFCINLDLSKWDEMLHFILDFVQGNEGTSEFLFKNDWREKINIFV